MTDPHTTLTPRAERVIGALLVEQTLEQAALKTGVSARTIYRWLAEDEEFQRAYRLAKRRVVEQAQVQLQKATGQAVKTLLEVMLDPIAQPSSKVAAARTVLEYAIKAVEIDDLEARIEALERVSKIGRNGASADRG
jgi:hypothetical protein